MIGKHAGLIRIESGEIMKRFIKIFLLVLITLSFNINVYAECFRLPVGDKQIVIPDGWFGRCVYENSSGEGPVYTTNTNIKYIYTDYTYSKLNSNEGVKINVDFVVDTEVKDALIDERRPFYDLNYRGYTTAPLLFEVYNGEAYQSATNENPNSFNINGLEYIGKEKYFKKFGDKNSAFKYYYDAESFFYSKDITSGCPNYFAWHVDKNDRVTFSFQKDFSNVGTEGSSYGLYKLVKYNKYVEDDQEYVDVVNVGTSTDDSGLIVLPNDLDVFTGYPEYEPSKYKHGLDKSTLSSYYKDRLESYNFYVEDLDKCEDPKDSGLTGDDDPVPIPGQILTKTLDCPYYFEIFDDKHCTKTDVNIAYSLTYKKDEFPTNGKYLLQYESLSAKANSYFQEIHLASMDDEISKIKEAINAGTTYEGDYVKWNGEKLVCSNKTVTLVRPHESNVPIIFGQSRNSDYNNMYSGEVFSKSLLEESGKCLANLPTDDPKDDFDWDLDVEATCEGVLGKDLIDFINKIFRWICIIAPILVIVLGSVDFAGAILQDDKDAIKKASTKFIKRLIIAIAIFFIPIFLNFLFDIYKTVTGKSIVLCKIWR